MKLNSALSGLFNRTTIVASRGSGGRAFRREDGGRRHVDVMSGHLKSKKAFNASVIFVIGLFFILFQQQFLSNSINVSINASRKHIYNYLLR